MVTDRLDLAGQAGVAGSRGDPSAIGGDALPGGPGEQIVVRVRLPLWGILLLWTLLLGLPLLALRQAVEAGLADDEAELEVSLRQRMMAEMREYEGRARMQPATVLGLSRLDRRVGFYASAPVALADDIKNWSAERLARHRAELAAEAGMPLLAHWLVRPDPDRVDAWVAPRLRHRLPRLADPQRLAAVVQPLLRRHHHPGPLDSRESDELDDEITRRSQRLFGPWGDLGGAHQNLQRVMIGSPPAFLAHRYASYSSTRPPAAIERDGYRFAGWQVALFDGRWRDRAVSLRHAAAEPLHEDLRRTVGRVAPGPLPRYLRGAGSLVLVAAMSPEHEFPLNRRGFVEPLRRNGAPGRRPGAVDLASAGRRSRPVLMVVAPAAAIRSVWRGRWERLEPILWVLIGIGGLIGLHAGWFGLPAGFRLQSKIVLGFALGTLLPVTGLVAATIGWWTSGSAGESEVVRVHLDQQLERIERAMQVAEAKWSQAVARWAGGLARVIDAPREIVDERLHRARRARLARQVFLYRDDGQEFEAIEESRHFEKAQTTSLLRSLSQELLARFGVLRGSSDASREGAFAMISGIAGDFIDPNFYWDLAARPRQAVGNPIGELDGWVAIAPIVGPASDRVATGSLRGIAVLLGGQEQLLWRALRQWFAHAHRLPVRRWERQGGRGAPPAIDAVPEDTYDELLGPWRIRYHLRSIRTLDHFRGSDRNLALAVKGVAGREGAPRPEVVTARILADRFIVGLAWAERRPSWQPAGFGVGWALALIALVMALAMVIWVVGTARLLTWPLPTFFAALRATAAGDFGWRIRLDQADEYGRLARAFEVMVAGLREREQLSRFVSDEVMAVVGADHDDALAPGGEEREVTVLMSDIRGFTSFSEAHPPEVIVRMLNDYFTAMELCIRECGGSIDKFIGDAILAVFFDAPGSETRAWRALRAAAAMRSGLRAFNDRRRRTGEFAIRTGIGLASGPAVLGLVGSASGRLARTVLGATVERASVLESLSKQAVATGVMLDPATRAALGAAIHGHDHPAVALPGFAVPVPVTEVAIDSLPV